MDGYQTARWLKDNYPEVKVLALSMNDDEHAMIRMLKNGARGYVLKDCEPGELRTAIQALITKGYYHSEMVTARLIHSLSQMDEESSTTKQLLGLNDKEILFLKLACTEMTYKEIADQMGLSPRTIDGYRDGLFEKLGIKSRVGLVLFAIKNGIVVV
jgi:DNA-binding NarL/FixJ family response regulator